MVSTYFDLCWTRINRLEKICRALSRRKTHFLKGVGCCKTCFFSISTPLLSYPMHVCIIRVNTWCLVILWHHLWCFSHSWTQMVTDWVTIVTHLCPKLGQKLLKTCFTTTTPLKMSFSPKELYKCFPNSFSWSKIGLNKSKPMKHFLYLRF